MAYRAESEGQRGSDTTLGGHKIASFVLVSNQYTGDFGCEGSSYKHSLTKVTFGETQLCFYQKNLITKEVYYKSIDYDTQNN